MGNMGIFWIRWPKIYNKIFFWSEFNSLFPIPYKERSVWANFKILLSQLHGPLLGTFTPQSACNQKFCLG